MLRVDGVGVEASMRTLATAVLQRCGDPATARLVGEGPLGHVHHRNEIDCHDCPTECPPYAIDATHARLLT